MLVKLVHIEPVTQNMISEVASYRVVYGIFIQVLHLTQCSLQQSCEMWISSH